MKQIINTSIAAVLAMSALTAMAQPSAFPTTYPLPQEVGGVTPPQGLVNIKGPNAGDDIGAYVKGCQQIGVDFGKKVARNDNLTEKICIYKNGKETPEEELGPEGVGYDVMTGVTGSIMFARKYTTSGTYRIVIPEGTWIINPVIDFVTEEASMGPNSTLSPRIELGYEIFCSYRIYPQPGVVDSFDDMKLVFPGAKSITYNSGKMRFIGGAENPFYEASPACTVDGETVTFRPVNGTPSQKVTYYLSADPGAFTIVYDRDGSDYTYKSEKMYFEYSLPATARPTLQPAEGSTVEGFQTIILSIDESNKSLIPNDRERVGLYPIDELGIIDENAVCWFEIAKINNYQVAYHAIDANRNRYTTPFCPPDGEYVFVPNAYSYAYDAGYCPGGYNFRYTVKSGVGGSGTIEPIVSELSSLYELSNLKAGDKFNFSGPDAVVSYAQGDYCFVQDLEDAVLLKSAQLEKGVKLATFSGECAEEEGVRLYTVDPESVTISGETTVTPRVVRSYAELPTVVNRLISLPGVSVSADGATLLIPVNDVDNPDAEDRLPISNLFGSDPSTLKSGYHKSLTGIVGEKDGQFVFYYIDETPSGIAEITTSTAPEYYTLSGIKISGRPSNGIYIRRMGDKISKIAIK